jgi:hypothetical protein
MNWDAIGAVGEIFGAIAVFVSLVYLAVQTRNNTRALRSSAFHQVRESFSQVSLAMAVDPELAILVNSAVMNNQSLTDNEVIRYHFLLTTLVRRGESAYFQSSEGTLQMETWMGIKETLVNALSNDYGVTWLDRASGRFTTEYIEEISKAVHERT